MTEEDDDETGDSGMGTGSGGVQFLKESQTGTYCIYFGLHYSVKKSSIN